jgi:hypothetical protein
MITLRQLLERHPEWADLPIVVYTSSGHYDWVGCSGMVYEDKDYTEPHLDVDDPANAAIPVLVFAPN